jgi:AcrR family transcriptional regulator
MSPRAGLDKEQVVLAAAELLNAEGPAALNLNRLARRLGVQTPSLYNHVDGLPGLQRELALLNVRGLSDRLGQAAIGRSGPEALRAIAQAYRDYIKESPGVYMASLQVSGNRPEADPQLEAAEGRVVAVAMAVVASFGLGGEDGLHAVRGLRSVVHGFASLEVAGGFGLPLNLDESFHRLVEMFIHGLQEEGEG